MKKYLIIAILSLTFAGASYAQACPDGSVCFTQAQANDIFDKLSQLVAAKDAIAKLLAERGASDAVIASATRVIEDYKQLDAINGMMIVKFKQVIELYEKTLTMYASLVEKLEKKLDAPRSAWQKFVNAIKVIGYILAGAALKKGL